MVVLSFMCFGRKKILGPAVVRMNCLVRLCPSSNTAKSCMRSILISSRRTSISRFFRSINRFLRSCLIVSRSRNSCSSTFFSIIAFFSTRPFKRDSSEQNLFSVPSRLPNMRLFRARLCSSDCAATTSSRLGISFVTRELIFGRGITSL